MAVYLESEVRTRELAPQSGSGSQSQRGFTGIVGLGMRKGGCWLSETCEKRAQNEVLSEGIGDFEGKNAVLSRLMPVFAG